MTTTAWAHLPNARRIDAVLAHVKAHPELWRAAARDAAWGASWDAALGVVQDTARNAVWVAARAAAWDAWAAARDAAWEAAWEAALGAAWAAALEACLALIAWDDASQLMDMPVDAVRTLAAAGHHPAVLLLPARLAMEETL